MLATRRAIGTWTVDATTEQLMFALASGGNLAFWCEHFGTTSPVSAVRRVDGSPRTFDVEFLMPDRDGLNPVVARVVTNPAKGA